MSNKVDHGKQLSAAERAWDIVRDSELSVLERAETAMVLADCLLELPDVQPRRAVELGRQALDLLLNGGGPEVDTRRSEVQRWVRRHE